MKGLFAHLRVACDFVVIDAPATAETPEMARLADRVLIVGSRDNMGPLEAMADELTAAGPALVTIVLAA